jgi:hypothetical protein
MKGLITLLIMLGLRSHAAMADETMAMMRHGGMIMDEKGMIMNANSDNLPKDCPKISGDVNITIHAGQKHALKFPAKCLPSTIRNGMLRPAPGLTSPLSMTTRFATN